MRRMMLLILGLCVATGTVVTGAFAEDTADTADKAAEAKAESGEAKEILKKAEAALEKVKVARYKVQYKGTDWVTAFVPSVEGSAVLGEMSEYDIARFRCDVKLTPTGSEEAVEVSAGSDGDIFYLIDPKKRMVYADMDEAVLGTHQRGVQRVLMREFVAKEPFADDLKAEKVELKEATMVGDEPCHPVHVTRSEDRGVIWYISKKDWLPRRVDRLYKNREGEPGTTQLMLTDLVADTTFDPALFKVTVPEGFTKTDEFAP